MTKIDTVIYAFGIGALVCIALYFIYLGILGACKLVEWVSPKIGRRCENCYWYRVKNEHKRCERCVRYPQREDMFSRKKRIKRSRGHRSNFVYVDDVSFSQYMNPPEESTSTDEEDDTADFNKHMDELVRQDAMIRCAWGIGTEDDWRIYNEECAKEAAKIEGGKTDV